MAVQMNKIGRFHRQTPTGKREKQAPNRGYFRKPQYEYSQKMGKRHARGERAKTSKTGQVQKEGECTRVVTNNLNCLSRKIKRQNDRSPTCELTTISDTHSPSICHNVTHCLNMSTETKLLKKTNRRNL